MSFKHVLIVFVVVPLFSVILALGTIYLWYTLSLRPVSASSTTISVTIPENQTTTAALQQLQAQHLIRSAIAGRAYLRLHPEALGVRPGQYDLSPSQSLPQILQAISAGPRDVRVTFPEGWRREQYAERLQATFASVPNPKFVVSEFLDLTRNKEGQLFPDTYSFSASATAQQIVAALTANFAQKSRLDPVSQADTLIIASLVERESRVETERPIIAGIIKNRLDKGWLLNIDATVQYARDTENFKLQTSNFKFWSPLTTTQLPSVYNTYINLGLPPGPICNPGLSSIQAAQSPAPTTYMYYLHDAQGQVHFATTLEEHNRNVDKYLRP